jgi:hypothetical protein
VDKPNNVHVLRNRREEQANAVAFMSERPEMDET